MPKKKHKKHPQRASKAKKEDTRKDEHLRDGIRPAFIHALSNGWVQNSGVAFLLALIALMIAMATGSQIKTAAIGFAAVGTLALWILAVVVIRYESTEAGGIVITKRVLFVNPTGQIATSGPWWIKYTSPLGDTLSPLPVSMEIVIHNSQSTPLKVEDMRVSMQAKGNAWLQLTPVDANAGEIFWVGDNLKGARSMNDQTALLDFTLRKPISANSPVEGWLFFSARQEYPHSVGTRLRLKFVLTDTAGKTMEYTTPFEKMAEEAPPVEGVSGGIILSLGPAVDLSSIRYAQFWPGGIIPVPNKSN